MDEWKLGYFAGIIDGEGSIIARKDKARNKISYNLTLSIANTDLLLLQYLQRAFGGAIYANKISLYNKQSYQLVWFGNDAKKVLALIQDKLFSKKEQAELALEFPILSYNRPRIQYRLSPEQLKIKEDIYLRLKVLNKAGITLEDTITQMKEDK